MPDIVVTATSYEIHVEFNDQSVAAGWKQGHYSKDQMVSVQLKHDDSLVRLTMTDQSWDLDMNGVNGLPVDTIDGETPSDNADLALKLARIAVE